MRKLAVYEPMAPIKLDVELSVVVKKELSLRSKLHKDKKRVIVIIIKTIPENIRIIFLNFSFKIEGKKLLFIKNQYIRLYGK